MSTDLGGVGIRTSKKRQGFGGMRWTGQLLGIIVNKIDSIIYNISKWRGYDVLNGLNR
jgi:hypothetical protein